jgi:hypothetical protein
MQEKSHFNFISHFYIIWVATKIPFKNDTSIANKIFSLLVGFGIDLKSRIPLILLIIIGSDYLKIGNNFDTFKNGYFGCFEKLR